MSEHEFKMGDEVLVWDKGEASVVRGKFVDYQNNCTDYPFRVLLKGGRIEMFKCCKPYTEPVMRPMTHKEIFELMARESVVFRYVGGNNWVISHWDSSREIGDFEYCPVAELVEPLTESPWRKLEVEENK